MDLMNMTSFEYEDLKPMDEMEPMNTTLIVIFSLMAYFGIFGNAWMIWSLWKTWVTGSRFHFYLLSICVADILWVGVQCGIDIGTLATIFWTGGYWGCKIVMSLRSFGVCISSFILVGFNVDNIITAVGKKPVRIVRLTMLVIAVMYSLGLSVYEFVLSDLFETSIGSYCIHSGRPTYLQFMLYWIPALFVLLLVIPGSILTVCQRNDVVTKKMKLVEDQETPSEDVKRTGKITLIYNILFLVCFIPSAAMNFLLYCSLIPYGDYTMILINVLNCLGLANAIFNPIAYKMFISVNRRGEHFVPGI